MAHWGFRESLSRRNRVRRSVYETLRDELEEYVLQYGLVDSYKNFMDRNAPYPFAEKRELKPRARIPDVEYEPQNRFLILFVEDHIPGAYKKYIRFFNSNKVTKENLMRSESIQLSKVYFRNIKYFENPQFSDFLKALLPADYALLIGRDPAIKGRSRYSLSHFHIRIDWPIADAAEDLARELRYISKDLYEKGENYAEEIQKKFFEYYGFPVTAGGRRTAATVAAQFLKRVPSISTVYVASSESRGVHRLSERGVSKFILMKLDNKDMDQICENHHLEPRTFKKNYVIARENKSGVVIFQATYQRTPHAKPPEDGKLRDLNSEYFWLTVASQNIIPRPGIWDRAPLPYSIIYT